MHAIRGVPTRTRRPIRAVTAGLVLLVGLLVAGVPAGAEPIVVVTPTTGLVDAQTLAVDLTGFDPGSTVTIRQCGTERADDSNCTLLVDGQVTTDATGSATASPIVEALLRGPVVLGVVRIVDCRTAGCELMTSGLVGATAVDVTTLLSFDPDGALRPSPPVAVTPTTGLLDGQSVRVTGSGFDGRFVVPTQGPPFVMGIVCATGDLLDACTERGWGELPVGPDGTIDGYAQVRVLIDTAMGQIDCRTSSCELRVGFPWYPLDYARVPLAFDPGGPLRPSTLTVVPSTGLVDGQIVQVHGELLPQQEVWFVECQVDDAGVVGCQEELPTVTGRPDAQGSLYVSFTVRSTFAFVGGESFDCTAPGSSCGIVARSGVRAGFEPWTPIEFGVAPPPAAPVPATPVLTG